MSTAVQDERISIAKRLYMTATPRMLRAHARHAAAVDGAVFSMDDVRLFGRCVRSALPHCCRAP
jgi:predicted helicase